MCAVLEGSCACMERGAVVDISVPQKWKTGHVIRWCSKGISRESKITHCRSHLESFCESPRGFGKLLAELVVLDVEQKKDPEDVYWLV